MELIGKLASNNTSNIGMLPSASKDISVKLSYQCINIINNKERLNGLKGSTKMKNMESLFKYQSHIYNVQMNSGVNHRGVKMRWNNKLFPSLNVINVETSPYGSKGILRHNHYWSDPKLGPGIVAIIIIPCSCHACTTILSLSWDSKTKEEVNQPRYGRVYNCKYSQIIGCYNNWIIIDFVDDGTYEEDYEHINLTIIYCNVMNMSLIIVEVKYGTIDANDYSCHGYYIIKFSAYLYTLQA